MPVRLLLSAAILLALAASAAAYPASVSTSVNLRAGPGVDQAVIAVLPKGSAVSVGACTAGWCEVTHRSRRGYVAQRYLAATKPAAPKMPPYAGVQLSPPHSISFRDAWTRAPRMPGAGCFVNGALWALGRPATGEVVERARRGAAARAVRVARSGTVVNPPFLSYRLTLAVDKRNVIQDVRCG